MNRGRFGGIGRRGAWPPGVSGARSFAHAVRQRASGARVLDRSSVTTGGPAPWPDTAPVLRTAVRPRGRREPRFLVLAPWWLVASGTRERVVWRTHGTTRERRLHERLIQRGPSMILAAPSRSNRERPIGPAAAFGTGRAPLLRRVHRRATPAAARGPSDVPPVSRVLRRAAAPAEAAAPALAESPRSWPRPGGALAPPATVALDEPALRRVTDSVIQSLDRRLRAYRERTGRV